MARSLAGNVTGPRQEGTQLPGVGGNPSHPVVGPMAGAQGAYPGAWVSQNWNRHWEAGQGAYGWKFDVEKEIPYFPLDRSSARHLMNMGIAPLRSNKRLANSLLWEIYSTHTSALHFVDACRRPSGWTKERNRREAETLGRILDLGVVELGADPLEKAGAIEVLQRRFHAIIMADKQGNWNQACLLEELPSERTPGLHENIVRDIVTLSKLVDQANGKIKIPDDVD